MVSERKGLLKSIKHCCGHALRQIAHDVLCSFEQMSIWPVISQLQNAEGKGQDSFWVFMFPWRAEIYLLMYNWMHVCFAFHSQWVSVGCLFVWYICWCASVIYYRYYYYSICVCCCHVQCQYICDLLTTWIKHVAARPFHSFCF